METRRNKKTDTKEKKTTKRKAFLWDDSVMKLAKEVGELRKRYEEERYREARTSS